MNAIELYECSIYDTIYIWELPKHGRRLVLLYGGHCFPPIYTYGRRDAI